MAAARSPTTLLAAVFLSIFCSGRGLPSLCNEPVCDCNDASYPIQIRCTCSLQHLDLAIGHSAGERLQEYPSILRVEQCRNVTVYSGAFRSQDHDGLSFSNQTSGLEVKFGDIETLQLESEAFALNDHGFQAELVFDRIGFLALPEDGSRVFSGPIKYLAIRNTKVENLGTSSIDLKGVKGVNRTLPSVELDKVNFQSMSKTGLILNESYQLTVSNCVFRGTTFKGLPVFRINAEMVKFTGNKFFDLPTGWIEVKCEDFVFNFNEITAVIKERSLNITARRIHIEDNTIQKLGPNALASIPAQDTIGAADSPQLTFIGNTIFMLGTKSLPNVYKVDASKITASGNTLVCDCTDLDWLLYLMTNVKFRSAADAYAALMNDTRCLEYECPVHFQTLVNAYRNEKCEVALETACSAHNENLPLTVNATQPACADEDSHACANATILSQASAATPRVSGASSKLVLLSRSGTFLYFLFLIARFQLLE